MRKIALFLVLMFAGLVISGCGVQIKQEGNKIFTDADKDIVYKYTAAAIEKENYTIKERSKQDGIIRAVPNKDNEIFAQIEDDPKLNVYIKERTEENDIMVEIQALISGDVDEKQSTLVARRAVDQLIGELNKYGVFTVTEEGATTLPTIDSEKFLTYLESALEMKGFTVARTETALEGAEMTSDSEYNDPMKVKIEPVAQGNQVSVALMASIEGNYDRVGNEQKARAAINDLTAVVEEYPVVEKSMQQSYYFTTTKTAFAWSKMALDKLGYVIDEEDAANLTLTTQKDGLKIVVTATDIGDNASAVNVQINAEGGESRDMLESTVDSSLTEIRDELALYQYSKSDTKMFESTPLDKAFRMAKNALVARGYTVTISDAGKYVVAGSKSAKPVKAACLINSMGNNGVAIEITAYVNGKKLSESAATELAASEVAALIKYLGRYDKLDTK